MFTNMSDQYECKIFIKFPKFADAFTMKEELSTVVYDNGSHFKENWLYGQIKP